MSLEESKEKVRKEFERWGLEGYTRRRLHGYPRDKQAEWWLEADFLGLMQQLGAIPSVE